MSEPTLVVAHREHLWWLLAEASTLEHMIMCQYLFAEFSLKDGTAEGLSPEQAAAVERWRDLLRGIAVEEMLHLALVANLMSAIGAAPTFNRPNYPLASGYFPGGVRLELMPFGEQALRHFLYLERPEGMERQDAEGFVPLAPPRAPVSAEEIEPRGQEYATVGHLYRGIEAGLRTLTAKLGENALFVGAPAAQATPELFRWPQLIAVTGLDSAMAAVEEIIEQGEGARGEWQSAHYGRFLRIWEEYHALKEADPSFEPAWPSLATFTRQPFDKTEPLPVVTDPAAFAIAELAGLGYEIVLQLLLRFFTHTDETPAQLETLIGGAIGAMADVVRPLGTALARLPASPGEPGVTAGFAFEVYYQMSNMVPWREPAWALLAERTALLAERCAAAADALAGAAYFGAVQRAAKRAGEIAATLAAEVPARLRPATQSPSAKE
jgi:Ferritin-like